LADDHFSLFGLPARYAQDEQALQKAWHDVAAKVHPDRFATAGPAQRRVAMQWAARANEAYRTLRDPLARARYLCELRGVDLQAESNTSMSPDFLMQQMQWREALDEARAAGDGKALAALRQELDQARAAMSEQVRVLLDDAGDAQAAGQRVREWMFLEKLAREIDNE
jgi:Fe-S protein assembly co-chaperone HscB